MSYRNLGEADATAPSPRKPMPVGMMIGWASAVVLAAGMFYGATLGVGMKRLEANKRRKRRTSRRGSRRRTSVRRNSSRRTSLRRYKALSPSARKRMPDSSFALEGRRWPIAGPPGSSSERNRWQALQAIRYLNMGRVGSRRDYLDIRNAIIRRYGQKFWRSYEGPSWPKVEKAKRRRQRTRRTSRGGRRRLAANASTELPPTTRLKYIRPPKNFEDLELMLRGLMRHAPWPNTMKDWSPSKLEKAIRWAVRESYYLQAEDIRSEGRGFPKVERLAMPSFLKEIEDDPNGTAVSSGFWKAVSSPKTHSTRSRGRSGKRSRRRQYPLKTNAAEKKRPRKPYKFAHASGKGFKLVVLAPTLREARQHVKNEAISSIAYRSLKYVGQGHPSRPENWTAAIVRNSGRRRA